jgi:Cu(I)/Ag(I) efflux system membrane fusion protein/cobalt-zinc-cadmium efflux system membrane fusion protein
MISDMQYQKNRKLWLLLGLLVVFLLGVMLSYLLFRAGRIPSPESKPAVTESKQLYTCGMHPNVIQDHPGNCPICGMKLVPMKKSTAQAQTPKSERKILYWHDPMDPNYISDKPGKSPMGMELTPVYADEVAGSVIQINPAVMQTIGLRTAEVISAPVAKLITSVGYVVPPEDKIGIINLRFSGWIEKVHINQVGQSVNIGDPLFDIYSPDLAASTQDFLSILRLAKSNADSNQITIESATQRLLNFGMTEVQIQQLISTNQAQTTITYYSPFQGVVLMKGVQPGQYVEPGTDLYHLADLSQIWVEVSVYEENIPYIKMGIPAEMTVPALPGQKWRGKVAFINPQIDEMNRDLKVRLEFPNPQLKLLPGMFATIIMKSTISTKGILVPQEAVIHSGARSLVFLDLGNGQFLPREIELGVKVEHGFYQVLKGLTSSEKVVVSGQFLLDSESSLKEATQKMLSSAQKTSPAIELNTVSPSQAPKVEKMEHMHKH